jgi:hypothetical protein
MMGHLSSYSFVLEEEMIRDVLMLSSYYILIAI